MNPPQEFFNLFKKYLAYVYDFFPFKKQKLLNYFDILNFRKFSHFGPLLAKNRGQHFVKNVFFNPSSTKGGITPKIFFDNFFSIRFIKNSYTEKKYMGVTHLLSRYPSFSDVGAVWDNSETGPRFWPFFHFF